jgi:hypothetical protein
MSPAQLTEVLKCVRQHMGSSIAEDLEDHVADLKTAGLEDAMGVLKKRQAELDRQRVTSKSRSNAEIADMKSEAATCSKAIHILRAEAGRRKKGAKG